MQTNAVPRELIQSVGGHIYHKGAPCVPLSPTKGTRNAEIIYQAIKNLPDNATVRADFNAFGKPYIFFPGKEKKPQKETIKNTNILVERNDLANILHTIAKSSTRHARLTFEQRQSIFSLNMIAYSAPISRDFVAGDLKKDLRVLSAVYRHSVRTEAHERVVGKHRTSRMRSTKMLDQRLRQFRGADNKLLVQLAEVLGSHTKYNGESAGLLAVTSMRRLVKQYLNQPAETKKSLAVLIKENAHDPDLRLFAKLWALEMKEVVNLFCTYPWAKEMNGISRLILGRASPGAVRGYDGDSPQAKYVYTRNVRASERSLMASAPQSNLFSRASPQHYSGHLLFSPSQTLELMEQESSKPSVVSNRNLSSRLPDSPYVQVKDKHRVRSTIQKNAPRVDEPGATLSLSPAQLSRLPIHKASVSAVEVSTTALPVFSISSPVHGLTSPLSTPQLSRTQKFSSFYPTEVSSAAMPITAISSPLPPSVLTAATTSTDIKANSDEEVSHQFSDADE